MFISHLRSQYLIYFYPLPTFSVNSIFLLIFMTCLFIKDTACVIIMENIFPLVLKLLL